MTDKKIDCKAAVEYGYYSKVLKQPFDSIDELRKAEAAYYDRIKAKEDNAATKKADAVKVEDAFKALNQARKDFKDKLNSLVATYSDDLKKLQAAFESEKKLIHAELADAENAYSEALKAFTTKYPEGYHLTLKDGDFETTIEGRTAARDDVKTAVRDLFNLFDLFYTI